MGAGRANDPCSVLKAWSALEVLSPPAFREPEDLVGGDKHSVLPISDQGLPWEAADESVRANTRIYYQVLLGTIELEAAVMRLLERYRETPQEALNVKGRAMIALARLNSSGVPLPYECACVSSFAWGLPHALGGDLEALGGWPSAESALNERLADRLRQRDSEGVVRALDLDTLKNTFEWLLAELQLPAQVVEPPRYVLRIYEQHNRRGPPEPLLVNSFFLNYLAAAGEQFARNTATANLQLFLGSRRPPARRDLLNDRDCLADAVRPALFPPARWPGAGRHALVLLQQAAVNLALNELKDHGILAVNGPPGTGKTTLLRDIVAAVVTQRARAMAQFDDPASAFSASGVQLEAGNGRFALARLDARLRGFEILVASSNNQAVENISAELPSSRAIATDVQLRYFKTTSDALQGARKGTWGLIAAVLGNAANRARFKKVFWWDEDAGMATYLRAAGGNWMSVRSINDGSGEIRERLPRILREEDPPRDRTEALARWQVARQRFAGALERSEAALRQAQALHAHDEMVKQLHKAHEADRAAQNDLRAHLASKPVCRAATWLTSRGRAWRRECAHRTQQALAAACDLRDGQACLARLEEALDPLETLRVRLGSRLVDERFFARGRREYQLEAPWLDDDMHRLRDEVFIAAMNLHKAFIDAAAKPLRHNLGALMHLFSSPQVALDEALLAQLWASLFLVVPVLSSTFASIDACSANYRLSLWAGCWSMKPARPARRWPSAH